ncbi:gliding motility-associated C-terminal domain-containing protein [Fulvivirga maritima]|uniref:T9SS type B sorting domain-containing protein n=1 Tax=Fulvivirga maritima TaxID=2904247 RepID=UPI001F39A9AE|nr:gliding motility-associated C-terminal domain-containing protein [Fulvivirga maritima]UII26996.1 gliding motility-associated C-terminal domain-containing protein [Fulvivirga maritima]
MARTFLLPFREAPATFSDGKVDTTTLVNTTTPIEYIRDSVRHDIDDAGTMLGALQIAPDGMLYVAAQGQQVVSRITNPNIDWDDEINIEDFGLAAGTSSEQGLPNFIQNISSPSPGASINVAGGCFEESVVISVSNPLYLEHYLVNIFDDAGNNLRGPVELNQTTTEFTFTPPAPGVYQVLTTITNDCDNNEVNMTPQNFIINPLPSFTLAVQNPPSLCGIADGSVLANFPNFNAATNPLSYTVNGPVSYPATEVTSNNMVIENLSAGFYTVTTTNTLTGCIDTRTIRLNDPAGYSPNDISVNTGCSNDQGVINGFTFAPASATPATYSWQIFTQGSNRLVASGTESTNLPYQPLATGEYYVEITDAGGCVTTASITGTPPPAIDLNLPSEFVVCGETLARVPYSTPSTSIPIVSPSMTVEGDSIILITEPGTYQVTAAGDGINTCDTTLSVTVMFPQPNENPYESRYAICPFENSLDRKYLMLENLPGGFISVIWYDEDGVEIAPSGAGGASTVDGYRFSAAGDSLIAEVTGRINFEATNAEGCITEGVIEVVEDCEGRINAPNAFNPNSGNPDNQSWKIFPFLVDDTDFQIYIFNRWGEMIFQSGNLTEMQTEGWNGGYDNDPSRPVQGGTYAYKVEFRSEFEPEKGIIEQRGGITLIR